MSGIGDFIKVAASAVKINKTEQPRKNEAGQQEKSAGSITKKNRGRDEIQISDSARELLTLRQDAQDYVDEIKQTNALTENDITQLRQKIDNKYFLSDEVIDKIVDKLVELPNFLS